MRTLLRNGAPDETIAAAVRDSVKDKWIGHQINTQQFVAPPRPMYSIGG
jgi:GTP 3',8-cyclase